MFTLDGGAIGIKGGVAPEKKSTIARGGGEVFFRVIEGVEGGGTAVGPTSEGICRARKAGKAGRRRRWLWTTDPGYGHDGALSGPHPRSRRIDIAGRR